MKIFCLMGLLLIAAPVLAQSETSLAYEVREAIERVNAFEYQDNRSLAFQKIFSIKTPAFSERRTVSFIPGDNREMQWQLLELNDTAPSKEELDYYRQTTVPDYIAMQDQLRRQKLLGPFLPYVNMSSLKVEKSGTGTRTISFLVKNKNRSELLQGKILLSLDSVGNEYLSEFKIETKPVKGLEQWWFRESLSEHYMIGESLTADKQIVVKSVYLEQKINFLSLNVGIERQEKYFDVRGVAGN